MAYNKPHPQYKQPSFEKYSILKKSSVCFLFSCLFLPPSVTAPNVLGILRFRQKKKPSKHFALELQQESSSQLAMHGKEETTIHSCPLSLEAMKSNGTRLCCPVSNLWIASQISPGRTMPSCFEPYSWARNLLFPR